MASLSQCLVSRMAPLSQWLVSGMASLSQCLVSRMAPLSQWLVSRMASLSQCLVSRMVPLSQWLVSGMASLSQWHVSNIGHGLPHRVGTLWEGLLYLLSRFEFIKKEAQTWRVSVALAKNDVFPLKNILIQ